MAGVIRRAVLNDPARSWGLPLHEVTPAGSAASVGSGRSVSAGRVVTGDSERSFLVARPRSLSARRFLWSKCPLSSSYGPTPRTWARGAHLDDQVASGLWALEVVELSINARELLAIERALKWFAPLLAGSSVTVFADNSTAVSYLRHQGGTRSSFLNSIAQRILRWAEDLSVVVSPQFIMGKHIVLVDALSHPNQILGSEWTLKQEVFGDLCRRWPVSIDLFATSQNHRCSIYFSPYHDHNALGMDALLQNWNWVAGVCFSSLVSHSGSFGEAPVVLWSPTDHRSSVLASEAVVSGSSGSGGRRPGGSSTVQRPSCQPHFHRFHLGVSRLCLHAWRLSSDSPVQVDSPSV